MRVKTAMGLWIWAAAATLAAIGSAIWLVVTGSRDEVVELARRDRERAEARTRKREAEAVETLRKGVTNDDDEILAEVNRACDDGGGLGDAWDKLRRRDES